MKVIYIDREDQEVLPSADAAALVDSGYWVIHHATKAEDGTVICFVQNYQARLDERSAFMGGD